MTSVSDLVENLCPAFSSSVRRWLKVVDFTVVGDVHRSLFVMLRLVTSFDVYDAKSSVCQSDLTITVEACVIRTSMFDDTYHVLEESFVIESDESSYAAEDSCPPLYDLTPSSYQRVLKSFDLSSSDSLLFAHSSSDSAHIAHSTPTHAHNLPTTKIPNCIQI